MEKVHWSSQFDQIFYFLTPTAILGADGQLMWNVNKQNILWQTARGKKINFVQITKLQDFIKLTTNCRYLDLEQMLAVKKWTRSWRAIRGVAAFNAENVKTWPAKYVISYNLSGIHQGSEKSPRKTEKREENRHNFLYEFIQNDLCTSSTIITI